MKPIDPFKRNVIFDEEEQSRGSRSVSPEPSRNNDPGKSQGKATQANSVTQDGRPDDRREKNIAEQFQKEQSKTPESNPRSRNQSVLLGEAVFQGFPEGVIAESKHLPHPVLLYSDGFYFGMMRSNKPDGYGLFCYNSGDVYVGLWSLGDPSDHGYYYFAEGGFFFGQVQTGLANGAGLLLRLQDEFFYQGTFDFGFMQGPGFLCSQGQSFECIAKANEIVFTKRRESRNSLRMELPSKVASFEEEWSVISLLSNPESKKQAQLSGAQWPSVYFGEKDQQGRKHGVGTLLNSNGSRYHGMFYEDKILGFGVAVDLQGNIRTGYFGTQGGMHMFGSCSIDKDIYFGGFSRGLYSGPALYKDSDASKWVLGMFEGGDITNTSYTGDGSLSLAHVSLGAELLELIVQKAFGSFQKVNSEMSCTILANRNCPTRPEDYPSLEVQLENLYFRKLLRKYLVGSRNYQKKVFAGSDWEKLNKNPMISTKDMYKELFSDYLDTTPLKSNPFQTSQTSNIQPSQVSNLSRQSLQDPQPASNSKINQDDGAFSFRDEAESPRNFDRKSSPSFSNQPNSANSLQQKQAPPIISSQPPSQQKAPSTPADSKPTIKKPNFDFLDDFSAE